MRPRRHNALPARGRVRTEVAPIAGCCFASARCHNPLKCVVDEETKRKRTPKFNDATQSEFVRHGLRRHGSDACVRYLLRRSASFVNKIRYTGTDPQTGQKADSEEVGSGCPMKWGDRYFVLSAGHVFEGARLKDLRLLIFTSLPSEYKAREALTMHDIVDALPLPDTSVIHRCQWEDLALVTVDSKQFPDVEFTDPGAVWTDPAQGENVNCCGFPADHSVRINQRRVSADRAEVDLAVWPTAFGGQVLAFPTAEQIKFYYSDLNSDRHYLVAYDGAGVSKHPRGVSGAAVWWEPENVELVWRPNFRFAGTVTHSHRSGSVIRVVKASVVRRFLAEVFGNIEQ
jgi:hypothetical protein